MQKLAELDRNAVGRLSSNSKHYGARNTCIVIQYSTHFPIADSCTNNNYEDARHINSVGSDYRYDPVNPIVQR